MGISEPYEFSMQGCWFVFPFGEGSRTGHDPLLFQKIILRIASFTNSNVSRSGKPHLSIPNTRGASGWQCDVRSIRQSTGISHQAEETTWTWTTQGGSISIAEPVLVTRSAR